MAGYAFKPLFGGVLSVKLRHVRAAAVFGIVVVALTGARGHHGGSCGGSSHSSSSSSGGSSTTGGTTSGGTTGDLTSGGTTTGGTTGSTSSGTTTSGTSGITTGGTGSNAGAMRDIRIASCSYSETRGITAKLTATNSSATDTYTYRISVKYTGPDGALVGTRNPTMPYVGPGKSETLDVSTVYVPKPGSTGGIIRCTVTDVTRTKSY